jgi:hypothetical protein
LGVGCLGEGRTSVWIDYWGKGDGLWYLPCGQTSYGTIIARPCKLLGIIKAEGEAVPETRGGEDCKNGEKLIKIHRWSHCGYGTSCYQYVVY